ncbi:MAG: NIPSNAP family protein [Bryobacteraceae bacterium]
MNRRTFLKFGTGGSLAMVMPLGAAESKKATIELRQFQLRNTVDGMGPRTIEHLGKSYLPALRRAGSGPVGLFGSLISPESPYALVLSSYPSVAAWDEAHEKLRKDKQFERERDAYRASGQGYVRMEATLLRGFDSVPDILVPSRDEKRAPRIFELRTYESNNIDTLKRKVGMFNEGEIGIFRRLNMLPVFFGETIVGRKMPNLTYMLAFDDLAAREKAWKAFGSDPGWQKMKAQPGLTDPEIVSNITNSIVQPLPHSEIR